MKITTFNPQIITRDATDLLALFEELGFEKTHTKSDFDDLPVKGYRMKDASGFAIDISESNKGPAQDVSAIRMNVDNFDEAYQLLLSKGFQNFYGDKTPMSATSKSAVMVSPKGVCINLVEHLK